MNIKAVVNSNNTLTFETSQDIVQGGNLCDELMIVDKTSRQAGDEVLFTFLLPTQVTTRSYAGAYKGEEEGKAVYAINLPQVVTQWANAWNAGTTVQFSMSVKNANVLRYTVSGILTVNQTVTVNADSTLTESQYQELVGDIQDLQAQDVELLAEVSDLDAHKVETVYNGLMSSLTTRPVSGATVGLGFGNFTNNTAKIGDYFWGIHKHTGDTYLIRWQVMSKSSATYVCKIIEVVSLGNFESLQSSVTTLLSDSQNNIRNIQWVESGNSYSIKFTRKDGSTVTVSVPLTAIKNELNSLDGRLDTAENDIDNLQSDVSGIETDLATKQNKTDNALQTTNKNIVSAINEVREIAIGAEKPVGFANYQTMITAFNALSATTYEVGQSIFIGTLDVPDVWVLAIEQTSVPYTYTTDEAIVNALKNGGSIQVGYYRLSQLETGKVTTDHSELSNLDYANSGHTGFQPTLVSGTNIKTINNQSVLGSGNIEIQSGADDYDDLEHIPVVNADLETIVPVENTYYCHQGTGGGGAVATPFVLGQTYDKVYFDTSKSVEEMETILSGLEYVNGIFYPIVGSTTDEDEVGVMIYDLSAVGVVESGYAIFNPTMDTCFFSTVELTDLSATVGWQNLDADGSYTFDEFSAEYVNNVSFLSASSFESQFIDGVIYLYRDGEYQPLYGGRPMRWGTIQGTVTDQQDLVQYLNGFSKTVIIESGQSDVQGIPQLTAQQITTACDEFQAGANVLIKIHNSASYLAVLGAHKLSTLLSEIDAILYNGDTRYYLNYLNTNGTVSITQNTLDTNAIVTEIGNIETALQTIRGTAQ